MPVVWESGRVLVAEGAGSEKNGGFPYDLGAFDLDGTVLRRDLTITRATIEAFGALRERGMRLVVATWRTFEVA